MSRRYQVRNPAVIHEVFDDEVVIVNLDSGDYFSLSDSGVAIWNCLLDGCSVDETIRVVASRYEGNLDEIRASIQSLIETLEEENLVVRQRGDAAPEAKSEGGMGDQAKAPFVAPVLNRYSDMRDLLLIDPIHDVDETGWPRVKQAADDSSDD